jgi:hypothetical protein
LKSFIFAFSETDINLGFVKGATRSMFIHCMPESVDERIRAFALLHSKKLQKVLIT